MEQKRPKPGMTPLAKVRTEGWTEHASASQYVGMRAVRAAPPLDDADVDRALARLHALVRERGLKSSSVRDAIARAAVSQRGHFTPEDLVRVLREGPVPEAHAATVYRVLPLLLEAGLIQQSLVAGSDRCRYERSFEREHHDHLVCTQCHRVVEFHFEAIEMLQRDLAAKFGFELTGHVHELLGTCRECRRSS